jgi:alkanesulfonate monooxygenase SsuD/methylene tetrahydromethanopterin reductase-like flavin-dependent oxidoreductase (luciferase family)
VGGWPGARRKLGLGLMLPISERHMFGDAAPRFADMLAITRMAQDVGFDVAWLADHLIVRLESEGNMTRGVWDCWTMAGGLAAATDRIKIGTLVACTGFRHPVITAKMAEAMDDISDGRFILGLGAGWHRPEYDMLDLPYDHRVSRFDEAMQIIYPLVRDGATDFAGDYYRVTEAVNRPRGPRAATGGSPILIGGSGPRMMRLTARYADAWNSDWHRTTETLAPLLTRLDEACHEVGRDPATLVRTCGSNIALPGYLGRRPNPITGSPEEIAAAIRSFADLGIRHHVCGIDPCTHASVEWFGRVIELLND